MNPNALSHRSVRVTSIRYRHAYLLVSLLLVIVVRPFLAERLLGVGLIDVRKPRVSEAARIPEMNVGVDNGEGRHDGSLTV